MGAHPATASPLVRRYTLEEFWELEAPLEGGYYELIAGVLYVVPPPTGPHNIAISNLNRVFSRYLDAHPGAGHERVLDADHVRALAAGGHRLSG